MTKIEQWIREEARAEGWMLGKQEGWMLKARQTAHKLLKKGYPPEEVAEATELPLEEVLELKNKAADSPEKPVQ